MPRRFLAAAVWVAVVAVLPVMAQTGSIEITVVEAGSGDSLPGATVTLSSGVGLISPTAEISNSAGIVRFPVLRAGEGYAVDVALPGFSRQLHRDIRVRGSQTVRLLIQLTPQLEERVRVIATGDVVDLEQTGGSTHFSDDFIENIPVPGRFYQNVLTLAPGVNDADEDGNPNVHGARARNFQTQVSGVSNVDPLTGEWLSYVNYDTIEEIEIMTWGAGAEFSRAQGGFARILQKQGSNELEGLFNFLYRTSDLDGDGAGLDVGQEVPEFESLQPAIQVSGPIVRDKLWFRLSHELVRREDPLNLLNDVGIITRDQKVHSDQITWQVSPRNKLAFQYQYDPLTIGNFDISTIRPPESSRTFQRGGPTFSIQWVTPLSSKILVDSRVAYQDHETAVTPSEPDAPNDCVKFFYYPLLDSAGCFDATAGLYSGPYPENFEDSRQRFTARSDVTLYIQRFAGASHQLKIGFLAENERYYRELARSPDQILEKGTPLFPPPQVVGRVEITVPVPTSTAARATGMTWGLYVEDQIKPTMNLSIKLGLRYDREEIRAEGRERFDPESEAAAYFADYIPDSYFHNRELAKRVFTAYESITDLKLEMARTLEVTPGFIRLGTQAVQSTFWHHSRHEESVDITNDNVSPRVGISWDPFSDGKTKLSGTWGRYYDKIFLAVPLIELEPASTEFDVVAYPEDFFYGREPLVYSWILPPLDPTVSTKLVDRDLRTPYQDEYSFSFERALWTESSIKLSYLRREFRDQLQDVDINHDEQQVVFNPGWGELLLLGNFNSGEYEAWVLELVRRFYRGWELNASYTWSRSIGDAEDFDQLLGNARGLHDSEVSYQSYDQRHVVRINAMTLAARNIRLGSTLRWESGLPYSLVSLDTLQFVLPDEYGTNGVAGDQKAFVYRSGKRNDERNESFWTIDVRAAYSLTPARSVNLELALDVFNLLNDDTLIRADTIDGNFAGTRRFGRQYQVGLRLAF